MLWNSFYFDNQKINIDNWNYRIWLVEVPWTAIDSSDFQTDIQGTHWITVSPTYARGRRIAIQGVVFAKNRTDSANGISFLQNLFALDATPSQLNLKEFKAIDELGNEWAIQTKIKEPLEFQLWDEDQTNPYEREFRVVLQSPDARYFSANEINVAGAEWFFGWIKLWQPLPYQLNEFYNKIEFTAQGNIATPLKIKITATGDINQPLVIRNLDTNEFFGLNTDAVAGDIIEIDSKLLTATKNGVNILADRISGSSWLSAKWLTRLSVYDNDGGLYESDFNVDISFRNVLL